MLFFNLLSSVMGVEWGELHIKHGKHTIFVPTKHCPKKIWLHWESHGHAACCQSPVDTISYKMLCGGFEITADIQTNKCHLMWFFSESLGCSCDRDHCEPGKGCEGCEGGENRRKESCK